MPVFKVYDSLTRKIQEFKPINPPFVGIYVCGPTVYSDPHLGHSRPGIVFDVLQKYLAYLGYKVRFVSNITDVGHLEDEVAGLGEDRIQKKARLEKVEPMEVVQHYTNRYREAMRALNIKPPSIEPLASGHIPEQIRMVRQILDTGFAYEVEGNIYFDVVKYNEKHNYGKLSGRVLDELMTGERELEGQENKRNQVDFALWKKAAPEHLMRWESPWGEGFPGWHLECSVMGGKYLGVPFDIHGGGMDLKFPHHECEISQSVAAFGKDPVKYWIHNNMITIDGQKMSRSLGNFITIEELFKGTHKLLSQAYSPMTLRFFILQTHYRSTLDFSNDALKAAGKGLKRLMTANELLARMPYSGNGKSDEKTETEIKALCEGCFEYMNDDLNTPQTLANLFELSTKINSWHRGQLSMDGLSKAGFEFLQSTMKTLVEDILGLKQEESGDASELTEGLVNLLINLRKEAKDHKDFATSDRIRDELQKLNVTLNDGKDGVSWSIGS